MLLRKMKRIRSKSYRHTIRCDCGNKKSVVSNMPVMVNKYECMACYMKRIDMLSSHMKRLDGNRDKKKGSLLP